MLVLLVRTVIIYIFINVSLRMMGKRQIGQLQPSELVITILISDIATMPIGNTDVPLINGVLPVAILVSFEVLISYATLKSDALRRLLTGRPSVLIFDGELDQDEMKRLRLNIDDLVKELRSKDILSISEVRYAILETNGHLSVFPKAEERSVKTADMGLSPDDPPIPFVLISGGRENAENLKYIGKNQKWLDDELRARGLNAKKVLYMTCDAEGHVVVIKKEDRL